MSVVAETDEIISHLKTVKFFDEIGSKEAYDLLDQLKKLLTEENSVLTLKQANKSFEYVLLTFTKLLFYDDVNLVKLCLLQSDVVIDIYRSKLPKFKRVEWWKKFELENLVKSIPKISEKISLSDVWVDLWIFCANLIISDTALSSAPLNALLSVTEQAFKKGKHDSEVLDQTWKCWGALIKAFGKSPNLLLPSKSLNLLMKPLVACHSVSSYRVTTWILMIEVKGFTYTVEALNNIVESFCKSMYKLPGDKLISRHLPDACAEALVKLLSFDKIVENCLPIIIDVFGSCLSSRPSVTVIEQLVSSLVKCVNECEANDTSYQYWKSVVDQYRSCTESPILKQACHMLFDEVQFSRWVESGVVGTEELNSFMVNPDFRGQVLLRSIQDVPATEDANTPKKKSRKGTPESAWEMYCEIYTSYWVGTSPPKDKENISLTDNVDYQAMEALMMYPLRSNSWNPSMYKTWTAICEQCHKLEWLYSMCKGIWEALTDQKTQKVVEVLNFICGLDNNFCKQTNTILEELNAKIHGMDVKLVMEFLNLLEIAASFNEMSPVVHKAFKEINEKCLELDQLAAHKIKTKIGKISRKIEPQSADIEKSQKTPRTPFRTQSNFLLRLAKAEEKNKSKTTFISSIFPEAEHNKIVDNEAQNGPQALESLDSAESIQSLKSNDSENVLIVKPLVSPNSLKENLVPLKSQENLIAADKKGTMSPSSGSPSTSTPPSKMRITNARELRTPDASSPSLRKTKPLAGQKITPKKITPSKVVSYFDDDAKDCVMVPPKPKTTPLTEHQMEIMTKRRADIPALYQDLSQDTQLSNTSTAVHEINNGVADSEDVVTGTPSPVVDADSSELKNSSRTSSAKKLDFNTVLFSSDSPCSTKLSEKKSNPPSDSEKNNENLEQLKETEKSAEAPANKQIDEIQDETSVVVPATEPIEEEEPSSQVLESISPESTPKEKTRRKRKSEPVRFSPKLTRSRRSQKSGTPDSKLGKSVDSAVRTTETPAPDETKPVEKIPELPEKEEFAVEHEPVEEASKSGISLSVTTDEPTSSNKTNDEGMECQTSEPVAPERTPTRKRKIDDSENPTSGKKAKPTSEEPKKINSAKKKKKLFKLGNGNNNLENWLFKTERTNNADVLTEPSPPVVDDDVIPDTEVLFNEPPKKDVTDPGEKVPDELQDSFDVVPSTQEMMECAVMSDSVEFPVIEDEIGKIESSVELTTETAEEKLESELNREEENEMLDVEPIEVNKDVNEDLSTETTPSGATDEEDSTQPTTNGKAEADEIPSAEDPKISNEGDKKCDEEVNDDEVPLIISSPSKRKMRASSVFRGEGDTYLNKLNSEVPESTPGDSPKRLLRNRLTNSARKNLHPAGGRSAKMLRLVSSTQPEEEVSASHDIVTPTRRRESIVPVTYGENWPTGPSESWIAYQPSPCQSPFRGVLKKTPTRADATEEPSTPVRTNLDHLNSPFLSSSRRKRVVFLDPPVTRGLLYDRESFQGVVHLADVHKDSPQPAIKDEEVPNVSRRLDMEADCDEDKVSPEKTPSNEDLPEFTRKESNTIVADVVSDEIRELINTPPTDFIEDTSPIRTKPHTEDPSALLKSQLTDLTSKFNLTDEIEQTSLQHILAHCLGSEDMVETVEGCTVKELKSIANLPRSFLQAISNQKDQVLSDVLDSCISSLSRSFSPPVEKVETKQIETNTDETSTSVASTQADLDLPSPDVLSSMLKEVGIHRALNYFGESLKLLSSCEDLK